MKTPAETGEYEECKGPDDHGGDHEQGGSPLAAGWCKEAPADGEPRGKGDKDTKLGPMNSIA
jgi:hypothetical protein